MDKEYAKTLIKNLFEQPFLKKSFIIFIKNLLNHINEETFIYRGNYIPEAYRGYIRTIERIGKYQDQNDKKIDILVVTLEKETTLERARTLQRNIIAWYLNGSRGGQLKDAALVAFISPNNQDWRFSFVKMEYKFVRTEEGTIRTREELTPAKRYSFLVGPNEASHTAQSQMVDILKNDETDPTLEEIEKIFNIETVSKEFFEKYRSLYEMLVKELNSNQTFKNEASKNNINTSNFAKKLLGQIVFLYFLQKKGWLGVPKGKSWGDGDRFFLTNLFKDCIEKDKNYFNDYLEILFYDTLNNPRSDKVDRNYSDHFGSKIPFLNGGLFEPIYNWKESFILLHNKIFQQILDVFDLYNFTVKEDEPLEKDVAVDPEMLGKVFENLLEENLRKGKGTYYTPREIVHYMCQESLINYLQSSTNIEEKIVRKLVLVDKTINPAMDLKKQIKEKSLVLSDEQVKSFGLALNDIKICDPACGSGAFLVGMLQLIVSTKNKINGYKQLFEMNIKDKTEYELKKSTIQGSIYGVDIDSGAVEIAKLRLWLSLVVDYELEDIEPLPNLDYRIMVGNSLIEKFDSKLLEKTIDDKKNNFIDQLNKLKSQYFSTSDFKVKSTLRKQINELLRLLFNYDNEQERNKLFGQLLDKKNQLRMFATENEQQTLADADFYKKIDLYKDLTETDHFEWHINFNEVFEKGGFDVVIANPPYIKEYVNKKAFDGLRKSSYYQGKMDIWYLFACNGIDLLKNNGVLTFIAQNNWVTSYGSSKMRNKVLKDTQIISLIDFGDCKVFEAGIQTMVMIFQKNINQSIYSFEYGRLMGKNLIFSDIVAILNKDNKLNTEYLTPIINRSDHINNTLTFSNSKIEVILQKISSKANFILDPKKEVAQGIVPNPDIVGSSNIKKIPLIKIKKYEIKPGDGVFVISNNYFKNLNEYEKTLLKPLYEPVDLEKYILKNANKKEIIYLTKSSDDTKIPNLKSHLEKYREIMDERRENKNGRLKYYHLHWPRDEYFFKSGSKILSIRKCVYPVFSYTEDEAYVMMSINVIKTLRINQKYLTGLLNSKLITFWLKNKGKMQGNNYQIDKEPILGLPLVKPSENEQIKIINIVNKILNLYKKESSNGMEIQIKEYEKQIDQMVYKLYGLTQEETKIIESQSIYDK